MTQKVLCMETLIVDIINAATPAGASLPGMSEIGMLLGRLDRSV